jgi:hypothetical protein
MELLSNEIKTLPQNRIEQVLDFIEFIKQQETKISSNSQFEKVQCPICAQYQDPVTGELRFNAETMKAIEEGDAMLRGEISSKAYNSIEEMLADLDSDD